jgi:hypothetical protein
MLKLKIRAASRLVHPSLPSVIPLVGQGRHESAICCTSQVQGGEKLARTENWFPLKARSHGRFAPTFTCTPVLAQGQKQVQKQSQASHSGTLGNASTNPQIEKILDLSSCRDFSTVLYNSSFSSSFYRRHFLVIFSAIQGLQQEPVFGGSQVLVRACFHYPALAHGRSLLIFSFGSHRPIRGPTTCWIRVCCTSFQLRRSPRLTRRLTAC